MKRGIIFALILLVVLSACTATYRPSDTLKNQGEANLPKPNIQKDEMPTTDQPSLSTREFSIIVGHTSYIPDSFIAKKGELVTFLATVASGTSSHNHGITIDEFGVNEAITTTDTINPKIIRFVPNQSGTFTVYCKTCWDGPFGRGHPDIRATLVVEE